jgi:peptide/nickel transport system substrate-binding protein
MHRRSLLAGSAGAAALAALPRFAIGQTAGAKTLVFVPQANLSSLDPIWTTATVTRNYGYLVFDTLYGTDDQLDPKPQMAEGHTVDEDGKRWTIKLRDGLMFHDGEPVRAKDCVASLQRWMKRDSFGQSIAAVLDALEAPDDKTLVFRLKQPFPPLLLALAKSQPSPTFIMPERIANTDPFKQITEVVGSGPFRFVADEYVPGSRGVFAKFDQYKPRSDTPSSLAGAKIVHVDRVEWRIIPEPATAANALQAGEIDWLEMPLTDLLPVLKRDKGVVVGRIDPYGLYPVLRFNQLQGPTTKQGVRQAILAAIDSREVMQAIMGEDSAAYHAPVGAFLPGTSYANTAGMDLLGPQPPQKVQGLLKSAGYNGERLVLMHPTDQPFYDAMSQVVAASLKQAGMNVDDQAMDWGTVVQRRGSKEPLDKGGWSLFCTSFPALDYTNPLSAPGLRGNGQKAWYGWPDDAKIEQLRQQFIDTSDEAARRKICEAIQVEAFTQGLYVPLGQYFQSAAWRTNITGHLKGQPPLFWNVTKG